MDLIVVRGDRRKEHLDELFAATANSGEERRYLIMKMRDGHVLERHTTENVADVNRELSSGLYRGIHVDQREDENLLGGLKVPNHAVDVDFELLCRAKSDGESAAVERMTKLTDRMIEHRINGSYRGAERKDTEDRFKTAFHKREASGFDEYRGGLKDSLGRCSDVSVVVPKNEEWYGRMERVSRGLDAAEALLVEGTPVAKLDEAFRGELDESQDAMYGSVVHHHGFRSSEPWKLDVLERYDCLKLGVSIGSKLTGEIATVYRSTHTPREVEVEEAPTGEEESISDAQIAFHRQVEEWERYQGAREAEFEAREKELEARAQRFEAEKPVLRGDPAETSNVEPEEEPWDNRTPPMYRQSML